MTHFENISVRVTEEDQALAEKLATDAQIPEQLVHSLAHSVGLEWVQNEYIPRVLQERKLQPQYDRQIKRKEARRAAG